MNGAGFADASEVGETGPSVAAAVFCGETSYYLTMTGERSACTNLNSLTGVPAEGA